MANRSFYSVLRLHKLWVVPVCSGRIRRCPVETRSGLDTCAARLIDRDHLERSGRALESWNHSLAAMQAEDRVRSALNNFPGVHVLTSSFGAQAAVSLHLLTREAPDIPVILLDTGYLFPETYQFIEELTQRLELNLQVYRSELSPAWQEARYGRRWEQGLDGIERYNQDNKVEPMRKALAQLKAGTWFSGIRRGQASSRAQTPFVQRIGELYKVSPIADWNDRDIYRYLRAHDLPYHPLWHEGYASIGDVHTTRRLADVENLEETRFNGLKRECGLHEISL